MSPVAIFAALAGLPVCWTDRVDERKPQQLQTVAVAVSEVADSVDDAAALLAIAQNESSFSLSVHAGIDRGPGRGLWQLEGQGRRHAGPFVGLDLAATTNAASVALFAWDHSWNCGKTLADRFTAYAGRPCGVLWPSLKQRVATYWYVRSVMQKEIRGEQA